MDFRLAQPLRGIGGHITVPPPCPSCESEPVDPLPCALLQINQEAQHITASHLVVAVVTRMPEDHALTGDRVEVDLKGCCAVSVEDDDWVEHCHVVVFSCILYHRRGDPLQLLQHLLHLSGVDVDVAVLHTVACLCDAVDHEQVDAVLP